MAVLVYPFNSSGYAAAVGAANMGADVIGVEPTRVTGAMWLAGLGQTDREGVFALASGTHLRWGFLNDMTVLFATAAGISDPAKNPYLFPDVRTATQIFDNKIANYSVRIPKTGSRKRAQGKITVVRETELFDIVRSPIKPYPITACKFYDVSTSEKKVITYEASNYVDCGDEGDLAVKVCTTRIGRESSANGDPTNGVRPGTVNGAKAYDPETGERLPGIYPKPHQKPGGADRRLMAFNMRILVTPDSNRMNWADLNLPGYNPRNYDTDLKIAVARGYKSIPGSIAEISRAFKPGSGSTELDMNNGSLIQLGSNDINAWQDWFKWSWSERETYKEAYMLKKLGLFKAICSDPAWQAALPEMVADTKLWGLIPGVFVYDKLWAANQTLKMGDRRFKAPYIYEVDSVVDDDGYLINTFAPASWLPLTKYTVGTIRSNGTGRYQITARVDADSVTGTQASGGPSGKGQAITDGGFTWKYIGALNPSAAAGANGPSGDGTLITDGGRITWKKYRFFQPGMSPNIYVREGRRISGQSEQTWREIIRPEMDNVKEAITAYGYPHFDAHWVNKYANDNGIIEFEGGSGLDGGADAGAAFMKFGSIKPDYLECCNLLVVRCFSGTKMSWITGRIELSYIKIAEVAGMAAGIADQLGIFTGDLDYTTHLLPALKEYGAIITIPKAA